MQMLEELRGLISDRKDAKIEILDDYDDGAAMNPILTTRKEVTDPADPLSGNPTGRYLRQVSVSPVKEEPTTRQVSVRIYKKGTNAEILAEVFGMLRTLQAGYTPTQVFDVYILAIENQPYQPTWDVIYRNMLDDLMIRNPGLEFRTHWITRLAYGRDPYYRPYINVAQSVMNAAPPWIYFYIGTFNVPTATGPSADIPAVYHNRIKGHINVDGVARPASGTTYSLADEFNHAVRYPEEYRRYKQEVDATPPGRQPPEPSLRILLEQMNSSSAKFTNAIFVSLNGGDIVVPPMRNYSDPAKDPIAKPGVRVVTHPEQLKYSLGDTVVLRVYPYVMKPDSHAINETTKVTVKLPPAVDRTKVTVQFLDGGSIPYAPWTTDLCNGTQNCSMVPDVDGSTYLQLTNTPVRHPYNATGGGGVDAASNCRLYGLEYCPAPFATAIGQPWQDLNFSGTVEKNTARWKIKITGLPVCSLENPHTFDTWLGLTTTETRELANLSRTYAWIGVSPPETELYQFIGDPRYEPYIDRIFSTDAFNKPFPSYNWFWSKLKGSAKSFYTMARQGWRVISDHPYEVPVTMFDTPRFNQIFRGGLLNTASVFDTFSHIGWYMIMGNAVSNALANGTPWLGKDPKKVYYVNETWNGWYGVIDPTFPGQYPDHLEYQQLIVDDPGDWISLPWLGELYPDIEYDTWKQNGNLPSKAKPNMPAYYYRANLQENLWLRTGEKNSIPYGTDIYLKYRPSNQLGPRGKISFLNGSPDGNGNESPMYIAHRSPTQTVDWLPAPCYWLVAAQKIAMDFHFPLSADTDGIWIFSMAYPNGGGELTPEEWASYFIPNFRTKIERFEQYYRSADSIQSGIGINDGYPVETVTVRAAAKQFYFVVNGLVGSQVFLMKVAMLQALRAFMRAGHDAMVSGRIPQLPRVEITAPSTTDEIVNPNTITVAWDCTWQRWDVQPYTETVAYTQDATSTPVFFHLKYSPDNGKNWYFLQDSAITYTAARDSTHAIPEVKGQTAYSYAWNASSLPRGTYRLRVEAFRQNRELHHAYHERRIYIKR